MRSMPSQAARRGPRPRGRSPAGRPLQGVLDRLDAVAPSPEPLHPRKETRPEAVKDWRAARVLPPRPDQR